MYMYYVYIEKSKSILVITPVLRHFVFIHVFVNQRDINI